MGMPLTGLEAGRSVRAVARAIRARHWGIAAVLTSAALLPLASPRLAWLRGAQPSASVQIPKGREARTGLSDRPARVAWGKRHLLDGYDRVGRRDPRWDAQAHRLIELSIPSLLGTGIEAPPEERIAAGRAAVAAGCTDPLVLYLLGRTVSMADPYSSEPEHLFRQAVEGMKTVSYARALARYPATALFRSYEERRESVGLRPPLGAVELAWFEESLSDGSYAPDDDALLTWQLMNGASVLFVRRSNPGVSAAIDKAAWIDPWVKLHFSGLAHLRAAWTARGRGFAKDVKPENWERFRALSALARRDLEESWRLRPDRPESAYEMIQVSVDAPHEGEGPRLWFDRTVQAQMDFTPAYETMWVLLLPRWGGSYEQMLAFGREALETGRFDTEVPAQLLYTVLRIRKDQRDKTAGAGGQPVFDRPETYPLLESMFEGYLKEPSREVEKSRWEALWAVVADRSGKPAEAVRHLQAVAYRLTPEAAFYVEEDDEAAADFATRVVLSASPTAKDAAAGDQRREAFDVEGALAAYRAALARDPSPQTAAALARRIVPLEQERRLASGEWVPFLPASADLAGWKTELGSWRLDPDGSLVGTAGSRGLLLVSDARVGPDFEIRGRMELVSSTNEFFQGGVAFGYPSWKSQDWMSFRIKRTADEGQVAYFSRHLYGPDSAPGRIAVPDANTFLVRVQGGQVSGTVNGVRIQEGVEPKAGLVKAPDLRVGFGGYVDENIFSLRFCEVELRRLLSSSASDGGGSRR
jgi:hypothetical protein